MANKFLEQMKASDWINLGQLATNVVGGVASGKAAERTAEQASQQDAWNRLLQQYNAQMAARNQLGAYYDQLNATRAAGRQALLNASPLGAEQEYVGKQALRRGLMGVMGNFQPLAPASADIAGLIRPTSNVLGAFTTPDMQQAASVGATARSLAERRKALAGVDPTFQFGSMGDYGVPNLEKEVATYAQGVAADRLSRENQLLNLLTTQMQAANALSQPQPTQGVPPTQSSAAAQPKKTSWWKKVVGTALPIAAAFIPGVGPAASLALQAAAGAAGGALTGGKRGALTGAITGAIGAKTGGLGSAAGQRAATETAKEFTKRAILQPSTLTSTAGKLIGGQTGTVLQTAAPFLGGIKPYDPNAAYTRALPVQAQISKPADFTADILRQAGMGPAQAQQPFIPMQTPGIQSQLTSPLPTAAPAAPQAGIPVPTERTPQLSPEVRQMLEQVGRRRQQPVMGGAAPVGGGGANAAMRAPTASEKFRDTLSPVFDIFAGLGMPGARSVSSTVPMGPSPLADGAPLPTEQVLNTPIGVGILAALGMPFRGASAPLQLGPGRVAGLLPPASMALPTAATGSVRLLPGGHSPLQLPSAAMRAALPPGRYHLPAVSPSSQKTQLVVADLLDKINRYKDNPALVRALIAQLQPYLRQLPGVQ